MKILASTILSLGMMAGSYMHQDVPVSKVPNEVKNAFKRNFNNPADVEWEKKKDRYEVEFDLGNVDHSALYTAEGELLMVKMELNEQDLSPVIRQKISDDFREFEIDDIDQIKTGDRLLYQVELDGPSGDRKVVFTAEGEIDKEFQYWD